MFVNIVLEAWEREDHAPAHSHTHTRSAAHCVSPRSSHRASHTLTFTHSRMCAMCGTFCVPRVLQQQSLREQHRVLFSIAVGINFGTVLNARRTIHDRPYKYTIPFILLVVSFFWFYAFVFDSLSAPVLLSTVFRSALGCIHRFGACYAVLGVWCMLYVLHCVFASALRKKSNIFT